MNRGVDEALLAAAVKARAFKTVRIGRDVVKRHGYRVGQLNFSAYAGLNLFQLVENGGFKDIAADDGHAGRRFFRGGLFDDAAQTGCLKAGIVHADDAVFVGCFRGDFFSGEN